MHGDQMIFVQVPQNIPEPQLPWPKLLFKGKYKCSLCSRYFVRSCVWVLQKKKKTTQVKESKVVRLLQKVGEISFVWSPPEADGPVCHPPAKPGAPTRGRRPPSKLPSGNPVPNSAHRRLRSSVCLHLFHSQMTGTKRDYKNREQVPFFYFIINCTRYCIFVQIKMSQTSVCPLFASHRSLLNQMFLIL